MHGMSNGVYWFIYILFQIFGIFHKKGKAYRKINSLNIIFCLQLDKII